MKYTADEMSHPIRELSGGQKAKILLLKLSMSGADVCDKVYRLSGDGLTPVENLL